MELTETLLLIYCVSLQSDALFNPDLTNPTIHSIKFPETICQKSMIQPLYDVFYSVKNLSHDYLCFIIDPTKDESPAVTK